MSIYEYDKTAGNNNQIQGITITDGVMRTATVDNCFQALASDMARIRDDQAGQLVSTGSGGNYAITSNSPVTAYSAGMRFHFEANHTATGAATFNVNLIGAKSIYKRGTIPIQPNEIIQGGHYIVQYDAVQDAFIILNWQSADIGHVHTVFDITDAGALAALDTVGTSEIDNDSVTFAKIAPGTADVLRGHDGLGNPSEVTLGSGLTLTGGVLTGSSGNLILHVQHREAGDGGTAFDGSWRTRTMNAEVSNTIPGASLASNQITLPAGTYKVSGYSMLRNAGEAQTRIYNITDAATALLGASIEMGGGSGITQDSKVQGVIVLAAQNVFEYQYFVSSQTSGNGLGNDAGSGELNVYADLMIEKVA